MDPLQVGQQPWVLNWCDLRYYQLILHSPSFTDLTRISLIPGQWNVIRRMVTPSTLFRSDSLFFLFMVVKCRSHFKRHLSGLVWMLVGSDLCDLVLTISGVIRRGWLFCMICFFASLTPLWCYIQMRQTSPYDASIGQFKIILSLDAVSCQELTNKCKKKRYLVDCYSRCMRINIGSFLVNQTSFFMALLWQLLALSWWGNLFWTFKPHIHAYTKYMISLLKMKMLSNHCML